MHAKFGNDRLRVLGVVAGQISAFPIDLAGRPYNTLTLLCERVILKTSIMSRRNRLYFKVGRLSCRNLSGYDNFFKDTINFVALFCTFSITSSQFSLLAALALHLWSHSLAHPHHLIYE